MKHFFKGFLLGTAMVCLMALGWLFIVRPGITRYEAQTIKATYTQKAPGADSSGGNSLPISEEVDVPPLDFAALQKAYPNVKAWLTIPGTDIDYPVAQSSTADSEHYLRRNLNGERRVAGTLFFQADCTMDGKSLIVYGHNMGDGTMFGGLPMYTDHVFCNEHRRIILQTQDSIRQYTVAAVLETNIGQVPFNRTVFAGDADYLSFAQSLRSASLVDCNVPITADSRLLLLVTCSYSWEDARYVIVAVS